MLPDRFSRLLTAYVDGELDSQQRKAVLRLLRRSGEARELLRDLRINAARLRGLPAQTLGSDFAQQILQSIGSRKAQSARRSAVLIRAYVPAWLGVATAAAVLLVAGIGTYVYVAVAHGQKKAEMVAVHTPASDGFSPQASVLPTEMAPAPAESSVHERLGPPVPEKETISSSPPAVAGTADTRTPINVKQPALGSEVRDEDLPLKDPPVSMPLVFNLRDINQEQHKQQLYQELQKATHHRMDLRCLDNREGIARLQTAFLSQGIEFIVDEDVKASIKLGLKTSTALAVYLEEVSGEEMIAVLQQLGSEDRKAENKRRGTGRFESVVVNAMNRDDRQKVARLLGIDLAQLDAPVPRGPAGVDIRKPLSESTKQHVIRALRGQGTPRTEPAKPVMKTFDRQALVVAYTPDRPRSASAEVRRFLDSRREPHAGAVQILLVLHSTKR
jgi:hypothetical protein